MTPTPSPTEARARLKTLAQSSPMGLSFQDVADIRALLAREEALVGALREIVDVVLAMGVEYDRDEECDYVKINSFIEELDDLAEAALPLLNPDPLPETAEGDA
jgi:hypothetical protein